MIYTFYSYKGGAGRSMALANVARWFYLQGLRVVMIDWDLEAPGRASPVGCGMHTGMISVPSGTNFSTILTERANSRAYRLWSKIFQPISCSVQIPLSH